MKIALIKDNIVENIAEFDNFTKAMIFTAISNHTPVNIRDLPVNINDIYKDGSFYRNNEIVIAPPSDIEQLATENALLRETVDALILSTQTQEIAGTQHPY